MITLLLALAAALLIVSAMVYTRRLSPSERDALGGAIRTNVFSLLALLGLTLLPTAVLLPLPAWAPRWSLPLAGLIAWGIFAMAYWDRKVVPAELLVPRHPPPILPAWAPTRRLSSAPVADGDVHKSFRWSFTPHDGVPTEMALDVALGTERYQAARAEPRRPVGDWAHYAAVDMPELDQLAAAFHRLHLGRAWSTLDRASNVLSFAQTCIDYRLDGETTPGTEWPRYPIETLIDGVGDCEDDVILTAAVLKRLGFEVALLYYPGHCALGIAGADGLPGEFVADPKTELKFFYGEATAEGWHLGEVPKGYRGNRPEKIEVVHREVMDYKETTSPKAEDRKS